MKLAGRALVMLTESLSGHHRRSGQAPGLCAARRGREALRPRGELSRGSPLSPLLSSLSAFELGMAQAGNRAEGLAGASEAALRSVQGSQAACPPPPAPSGCLAAWLPGSLASTQLKWHLRGEARRATPPGGKLAGRASLSRPSLGACHLPWPRARAPAPWVSCKQPLGAAGASVKRAGLLEPPGACASQGLSRGSFFHEAGTCCLGGMARPHHIMHSRLGCQNPGAPCLLAFSTCRRDKAS